jgi:hypothetical protein
MANFSKFLSLINGVGRTVDLSNSSNVLELGGNLQMDGNGNHIIISGSALASSYQINWPANQAAGSNYVLANDGVGNLSWIAAASGSVTAISVSSANGFAGSSSGGATPALTLSTTVTGILYGNGTSMAAAVAGNFPTLNQSTTGTASNITASSNATLTSLSALTSASSLASVGTISSGVWQGTPVGIAYGGTGQSNANAGFAALSPMTTAGDMIYESSAPAPVRLGIGSAGQVLTVSGGLPVWAAPATSGTVTSVAFADDSSSPIYAVSGSPVTSSGTLAITLNNQSANMVFAGPASGSAAQPGFRDLVLADIPSLSSLYLPLSGGTMSGAINMGGHQINSLGTPSAASDAATKAYVDAAINGLDWQPPVEAFASSNVPLSGSAPLVIDSYTVLNGDRLILSNQSTASQNGTYVAAVSGGAYSLTATSVSPTVGFAYLVLRGTQYADTGWVVNSVSSVSFVQFSSAGEYSFNSPLSASGTSISLDYGNGLTVSAGNLIANLGNGLHFSSAAIAVLASDSSILVAGGGISVQEDAAGAIVTGTSGIKVQVQNGIQISGNKLDIKVADASLLDNSSGLAVQFAASSALATGGSGIAVQVDGSTIDINGSNQLEVKASGITSTQLASASVTIAKLATITDGVTLDQSGSGSSLEIKALGVGTAQLASASVTIAKLATITDGVTLDQSGSGSSLEIKASGVSATQLSTGAFDQVTIVGGAGSAASVAQAPKLETSEVAGQALSASTLYALRYELAADAGTSGQMYKADYVASSADNFYVIGLAYPSSAVSPGGAVNVVEMGLINVPSHGFTIGAPLYLGSSGALSSSAPSAAGDAVVKVGQVKDANNIWVNIQVMGVN